MSPAMHINRGRAFSRTIQIQYTEYEYEMHTPNSQSSVREQFFTELDRSVQEGYFIFYGPPVIHHTLVSAKKSQQRRRIDSAEAIGFELSVRGIALFHLTSTNLPVPTVFPALRRAK